MININSNEDYCDSNDYSNPFDAVESSLLSPSAIEVTSCGSLSHAGKTGKTMDKGIHTW